MSSIIDNIYISTNSYQQDEEERKLLTQPLIDIENNKNMEKKNENSILKLTFLSKISFYNKTNKAIALDYIIFMIILILSFVSSLLVSNNNELQLYMTNNTFLFHFNIISFFCCLLISKIILNIKMNDSFLTNSFLTLYTINHIVIINYINFYIENNYLTYTIFILFLTMIILLYCLFYYEFNIFTYLRNSIYAIFIISIFYSFVFPFSYSITCTFLISISILYIIIQSKIRYMIFPIINQSHSIRVILIYADILHIPLFIYEYNLNRKYGEW